MMKKIVWLLIMLVLSMGAGCSAGQVKGADTVKISELPREAEEYLNGLGDMQLSDEGTVTLENSDYTFEMVFTYIAPAENKKEILEWRSGGLSSLGSLLYKRVYMPEPMISSSDLEDPAKMIDPGSYNVYLYTSVNKDLNYIENKKCMILIEQGTENTENIHLYIWTFERVSGSSRPGLMIPVTDKLYTNYVEIGGISEE